MAEAKVAFREVPPGISRLFEAAPMPPVAVGAAISAGLLAAFFAVEWATGQIESVLAGTAKDHIPLHFRVNAVNSVLLGFLPTALYYLERWRRINHAELQPLLRSPVPLRQPSAALSHGAGVATAVALLYGFLVAPYGMELFGSPDYWVFEHFWDWVTLPVLGWLTGRFAYTLVYDSITLSRMANRLDSIDLLDPRPLAPFVRQGLRAALLVVVYLSVGAVHVGNAIVELTTLGASALFLALASAALLVPVWGAHRRIREQKARELAALRSRIARDRAALEREGEGAARAARDLPALLALEARIASVREWPFDASSLMRFGFYVAVGLGSWLGAAAVERLLDLWLAD